MLALIAAAGLVGCGGTKAKQGNSSFFTSGSREADQRASQRMAQAEQLAGSGESGGEKGVKKAKTKEAAPGTVAPGATNQAAQATGKLALYNRLGGNPGISNIVADFTLRVLNDPRVNWTRQGVTQGGFSFHHNKSEAWKATPQNVEVLKKHMVEFLALATGGPAKYTGRQLEPVHANMHITNPEFDAVIGDLKASLDALKVPNTEQKELLAIVESTRPEIVTER